jgi:hypothetical protein
VSNPPFLFLLASTAGDVAKFILAKVALAVLATSVLWSVSNPSAIYDPPGMLDCRLLMAMKVPVSGASQSWHGSCSSRETAPPLVGSQAQLDDLPG